MMDSHYINRNVDDMFSKIFHIPVVYNYEIKNDNLFSSEHWKVEELQELKVDLNRVKGKLNNYNLLSWHSHTRLTNRAGEVIKCLKKIKPELLTQAWCKFYEILSIFSLIPQSALKKKVFNTFHFCEAPGAFITSLNHFVKLNHSDIKWKWLASSLNPYFEGNEFISMINDDRFIVNTLENWCFGEDFTGNIMKKENFNDILLKAEMIKPIHLVTADGSVDCHTNPAEQETLVAALHYCETIAALSVLEQGGSFVLKIFTLFECQTVCLLYLLRCSFKYVELLKPVCSKEGNSEVYIVCLEYLGKESILPVLNILINNYEKLAEPRVLFPLEDIPKSFINTIVECSKFFKFLQVSAIERNIKLYESEMSKKEKVILRRIRASVAKRFMNKYNVSSLNPMLYIVENYNSYKYSLTYCCKDEDYSFADKVLTSDVNQEAIFGGLKSKLCDINTEWLWPDIHWMDALLSEPADLDSVLSIKTGKSFTSINSSPFCMRVLIEIRNIIESEMTSEESRLINSFDIFQDCEWQYLSDLELKGKHTLNFNSFGTFCMKNYNCRKLSSLQGIMNVLKAMKQEDTLIIQNFPYLTQFDVGLIYILGKMFQNVGFFNPITFGYTIIFYKLKNSNGSIKLGQVEETLTSLQGSDRTIVTLVPIKHLYCEEFYKCVIAVNHAVLKLSSLSIINSVLNKSLES